MQDLTITLIQSDLYWENPGANLAMFEEKIWQINQPTDLIILPEMFTTGFSMYPDSLAEPMNLTTFKWMKQMAEQSGAVVTGSIIVKEKGQFFNRLIWMQPDGQFDYYDKRHLFSMAGENQYYTAGKSRLLKEIKGWKITGFICYDLRFPVWSRNQNNQYDLAIYVANWPAIRSHAWKSLLPARAIENLCYIAAVNRTGTDGNNLEYSGDSALYDFLGNKTLSLADCQEAKSYTIQYQPLQEFRQKFPAHLDSDKVEIIF
jgi:omega-amidase